MASTFCTDRSVGSRAAVAGVGGVLLVLSLVACGSTTKPGDSVGVGMTGSRAYTVSSFAELRALSVAVVEGVAGKPVADKVSSGELVGAPL